MKKIEELIVGTNNAGKYREICDLLPKKLKIFSPRNFNLSSPEEVGKSFVENSIIKASYFSKQTKMICLADDSGLELDLLNNEPGIYSARWGGKNNNFNLAIDKVFNEIKKIYKKNQSDLSAKFICCLTLFWPDGKTFTSKGEVKGKISLQKKGNKGFGYDPIFIPQGHNKTFGEMDLNLKMSLDHRYKAFLLIQKFFA